MMMCQPESGVVLQSTYAVGQSCFCRFLNSDAVHRFQRRIQYHYI